MKPTDNKSTKKKITVEDAGVMRDAVRCLCCVIDAIKTDKSCKQVPQILNDHQFLSRFDMYDADAAWTGLEDRIRELEKDLEFATTGK